MSSGHGLVRRASRILSMSLILGEAELDYGAWAPMRLVHGVRGSKSISVVVTICPFSSILRECPELPRKPSGDKFGA